jgi:pyruvate,water dikinase
MSISLICATLGSGDAQKHPVGNKGRLLDKAKQAGLPVPPGVLILNETFANLSDGSATVSGASLNASESSAEQKDALLRLASQVSDKLSSGCCGEPYAVRSAFSAEDAHNSAMAGHFLSKLFVKSSDVCDILIEVWQSADRYGGGAGKVGREIRRDILIMSMVDAKNAGVAFTERDFEDDLINHCSGTADALVSGRIEGESSNLPKLRSFESSIAETAALPEFLKRLQLLLRDVRRVFGDDDWDIEWADDGAHCYLIQIRPITRPSRRNEAFTFANHREILPDLPSPFMTSLIASCADKLFGYYREFDPSLPANRPFIEVFAGRPLINLSLLCETMRILGLPTTLVTRNIGGADYGGNQINVCRVIRKLPVLLAMGLSQFTAVGRARAATQEMLRRTDSEKRTVSECVEELQWLYCTIIRSMQSLTAAMSAPLAILRRLNVLEEHNCRHSTISSEMYFDLVPLRKLVADDAVIRADVQSGTVSNNGRFQKLWQAYLQKHGHRGIFESDISRPRLQEEPAGVLSSLATPMPARKPLVPRTLMGVLTSPIWWQASRSIQAREQVRYWSMLAMYRIRLNLLQLAGKKLESSEPADLWLMSIERCCKLDDGEKLNPAEVKSALDRIQELKEYSFPDLLHRFDDLDAYKGSLQIDKSNSRLKGISLTSGKVEGVAAVLHEPPPVVPEHLGTATTILVARSVDAGWIPVLSAVKGVVVEIGGDLSHGSIILREIGLPSVTNVRGATQVFRNGDRVLLDADDGVVSRAE